MGKLCGNRCQTCFRTCLQTTCWRHQWWRYGVVVFCVATIISVLLPGAPLAYWTLSEDAERLKLLSQNEIRLQQSQDILEKYRISHKHEQSRITKDNSSVAEVGITVLTMARGRRMPKKGMPLYRTEYLTQSVATLLHLLNDSSLQRSYTFHICNIDNNPDDFQEAKTLEDILPVFKRYALNQQGGLSRRQKSKSTVWEKLKTDYVYCMQQTLALGVRYVMLVEDDAVAHHDLFHVLEHVMDRVLEAPRSSPVAYVKLYHPQRLLGYFSLEVERLTELLALSLVLGTLLTCVSSHRNSLFRDSKDTPYGILVQRWVGLMVVVAVLALAVGRTNLLELRRLSRHLYQVTPTPSCCIPAVLYTRAGAMDFANYLSNVTCTSRRSTDIRMDEFREQMGWTGLMVQPNLFSHIGLVSSLRTKEVSPLVVQ